MAEDNEIHVNDEETKAVDNMAASEGKEACCADDAVASRASSGHAADVANGECKSCEPCTPKDLMKDMRSYQTRAFRDLNEFMDRWVGMPFTRFFEDNDPFDYMRGAGRALDRHAHVMSEGVNAMLGNLARVYYNNDKDGSADVIVDMPGVAKDDVKVMYDDHGLTISHARHEHDEDHREYSAYSEYVPLKDDVDVKAATARLVDGQLRVHVPARAGSGDDDRTIAIEG